ncbi:hypothetical protein VTL71DRAFT_1083 [Oculimacula yallundae]|uniref:Uncharacterized protein n=1 Tax=Oculimacula yallundae TaxID=86028 RepID=A0ABR4D211_9HELO
MSNSTMRIEEKAQCPTISQADADEESGSSNGRQPHQLEFGHPQLASTGGQMNVGSEVRRVNVERSSGRLSLL